ncbi:phage major tail protein, TP901-1 family [Gimibacter soli]|uniref:Phage major tail protein, TP901-1 family n=1 Tax=Gimibacter soli TaxID=3024400 RepID=A0AAE9XSY2_9PROT|nr:phage major tail protein, TP901-1 family [Gimibacter soli]WCL55781.1 phage major tail protein, TP901-1 family [Gimibacter soli]
MRNGATYEAAGGFRTNSFTFSGETIDVTSKDSGGYRALMAGGTRALSTSGSGVFVSDDIVKMLNTKIAAGELVDCELVVPGLGSYSGMFAIKSLEMSGEHNGEVTYSISLDSAGVVAFTAEAA